MNKKQTNHTKWFLKTYKKLKKTLKRNPTRKEIQKTGMTNRAITKILKRLQPKYKITYPFNQKKGCTTIKIEKEEKNELI